MANDADMTCGHYDFMSDKMHAEVLYGRDPPADHVRHLGLFKSYRDEPIRPCDAVSGRLSAAVTHPVQSFFIATLVAMLLVPLTADADCSKNTDCKGERVCQDGKCVAAPQSTVAPANEARYFRLMEGNADIILKETRQGKNVTAAVLDLCYPADKGSERKDRFVANLAVNGPSLTGTTQSLGDKAPVSVKLTRKPTGNTFEFNGQISIGQAVTEIASTDDSDLSEKEFQDNQSTNDNLATAPKDFTEVSPEAIEVRVKLDSALDFLKGLKGQNLQVLLYSLTVGCDALRAGEQVIDLSIDPERAAAFVVKAKAAPGVVAAGWTSGLVDMAHTIRLPAAEWRDGDKLNRDKIAAALAGVLSKTLAAKFSSAKWSDDTGALKLVFKRRSQVLPALDLTETIAVTALVSPDKPGATERLMLWVGSPAISTADESAGPKLIIADAAGGEDEGEPQDDSGLVDALAKAFKGQRWDPDTSTWK